VLSEIPRNRALALADYTHGLLLPSDESLAGQVSSDAGSNRELPARLSQARFSMKITVADSLFILKDQFSQIAAIRIRFQNEGTIFMAAAIEHHFSGPVTVFQERRLPERATPRRAIAP
jgi:hypothetical protein